LLLSPPNISTGVSKKTVLLQQRQVLSRELNNMAQILHVLHVLHFKHRSTPLVTAVSYFRASNRLEHSDFRSRFLCFQTANQKFENPMSPEPFDSRAKAPPAKRSEKGYGDENGQVNSEWANNN